MTRSSLSMRSQLLRSLQPLAVAISALGLAACGTMAPLTGTDSSDAATAATTIPVPATPAATAEVAAPAGSAGIPGTEAPIARSPTSSLQQDEVATLDEVVRQNLESQDLWDRIRRGFAMPELDTRLVAEKERFYLQRPDYLARMFERGSRYLHHIVEEIEKRGMPTELALLPFVESAMNPTALSSAKAAGLWQFIPSTGKQYDLSQNWWVDNRRDVVQSTRAALDYLQYVYEFNNNDWFLALASYNWGEGAVSRAVKRNRTAGRPAGYLDIRMPNETRHYVPKLIALKHIIQNADTLGVALPELPDRPYFVTLEKTRPIDLKLAAEFAQMSVADFVALNPAHNRPVISASANNMLKIPADRIDYFLAAMARHEAREGVFASWQPYTLKDGESIADVARRGKVTTAELLGANSIAAGTRILPGTRILAPQTAITDEMKVEAFKGPRIYQLVNVKASYTRVRRGDTPVTIARRHGLTVAQLRALNGSLDRLRPGQSVMIRGAATQTVLVTETGERRIIRNHNSGTATASAPAAGAAQVVPTRAAPAVRSKKPQAAPARRSQTTAAPAAVRPAVNRDVNTKARPVRASTKQPVAPTRSASLAGRSS